MYNVCNKVG